jgi:hypothetical protein
MARSKPRSAWIRAIKISNWLQNVNNSRDEKAQAEEAVNTEKSRELLVELSLNDTEDPRILRLNDNARATLNKLRLSMFGYSRAYKALFAYHVVDAAIQLWQASGCLLPLFNCCIMVFLSREFFPPLSMNTYNTTLPI